MQRRESLAWGWKRRMKKKRTPEAAKFSDTLSLSFSSLSLIPICTHDSLSRNPPLPIKYKTPYFNNYVHEIIIFFVSPILKIVSNPSNTFTFDREHWEKEKEKEKEGKRCFQLSFIIFWISFLDQIHTCTISQGKIIIHLLSFSPHISLTLTKAKGTFKWKYLMEV